MTLCQYLDHGEQALQDQITWHRANRNDLPEKMFQAFEAGFRDAWRKAVADIRLHGIPRQ